MTLPLQNQPTWDEIERERMRREDEAEFRRWNSMPDFEDERSGRERRRA